MPVPALLSGTDDHGVGGIDHTDWRGEWGEFDQR